MVGIFYLNVKKWWYCTFCNIIGFLDIENLIVDTKINVLYQLVLILWPKTVISGFMAAILDLRDNCSQYCWFCNIIAFLDPENLTFHTKINVLCQLLFILCAKTVILDLMAAILDLKVKGWKYFPAYNRFEFGISSLVSIKCMPNSNIKRLAQFLQASFWKLAPD